MIFAEKILEIQQWSDFTYQFCKDNDICCQRTDINWNGPGRYAITIDTVPCGKGCCYDILAYAIPIDLYKKDLLEKIAELNKEIESL